MRNVLFFGLFLLVIAQLLSGCSSAPPPTNTPVIPPAPTTVSLAVSLTPSGNLSPVAVSPSPQPTATKIPLTAAPTTVAPPTAVPPTETPLPTAAPSATLLPGVPTKATTPTVVTPSKTPTLIPPTRQPSPTQVVIPSPTTAAGTYVTNLRVSPSPPYRGQDLTFYVTFQTDVPTDFRWAVYIYRSESPSKATGQTDEKGRVLLPAGTSEQQALGTWKLPLGGGCEYFFARVKYFDAENKAISFTRPDGSAFEPTIPICPPQ